MTTNTTPTNEAREWLRAWDNGELVWSIEMGGMGPSYEQCIQITAVEMLRWLLEKDYKIASLKDEQTWKTVRNNLDKDLFEREPVKDLGLSGAQYGAALSLAAAIYMRGTTAFNDEEVKDRRIQVSKSFPSIL